MCFSRLLFPSHDRSWAMNQAYNAEYGFEGLCERRSRYAQKLVPDSYLVGMVVKNNKREKHMILCKDNQCVDSTGVISDRFTLIPEEELKYHAYDIKRI